MRRATLPTIVATLLLSGPAAAAPTQPLGHHGRWITDADGRVVVLHGVAVVTGGFDTTYGAEAAGFAAADAELLAESGFNVVRLGFFGERLAPTPGGLDAEHLESFVRTHRLLAERGIFTLLDLHQDMLSPRYGGRGFADWFLHDDGLPNQPQAGFPGNYFVNGALNRAYDNLWANAPAADGTGLQDHLGELWRRVAQRFRDEDHLLGYDLFNEPWPGSAWPTCASPAGCPPGGFDQTQLTAFFNRVIAALRTADDRHLAFYEPNLQFDVGAATGLRRLDDPNVGMSFHDYCLGAAPGLPAVPDPIAACENVGETLVMRNAEQHSAQTGAALLLTEFGDTADPAIHRRVADLADRFMVGWTDWGYMGSTGQIKISNDAPPTPDNIRSERLAAVVRAYPPVIAGTPEGFRYDAATKRFALRYRPTLLDGRPAGAAETEVAVPRLPYGADYRVLATGAEVVRGLGTPLVALRACPNASRVEVVVTDEPQGEPPARCPRGGGRERPRVVARVSPRRDTRGARRFTTRVTLVTTQACSGSVAVRVKTGRRTISARQARVGRDCRARSRVAFRAPRRFGRRRSLRFLVGYAGNDALLPARARPQVVRVR